MKVSNYTETVRFLRESGYRELETVGESGSFAVQGDTLTVWLAADSTPVRLHFFGSTLERWERQNGAQWERQTAEPPELLPNALPHEHGTIYPGDYVVHPHHGVGIFQGMVLHETVDGTRLPYIALTYAGNDRLLIPADRPEGLMPYIGTRHPRLTRLYSQAWHRTTERIKHDLIKVARSLLKIYAARHIHYRAPYPPASEWEEILNITVDFTLTEDQTRSLDEVTSDLSARTMPMDRLLCGDVGFGKTEVALRAAARVMASGKQVAFIAPTTILAEQHYVLLCERYAALPLKVAHMSRLTKGSDASTIAAIRDGTVDMVVGTHRLLGKDLEWANLGLLIIDEEQKFGVAQKERLKSLRPTIDVLSLSATPIPRTLSLSLSGLRGLSMLRHAPQGRLPIKTVVEPYADRVVRESLALELARHGQVYVVLNRVQPLAAVADRMRTLASAAGFPEARIAVAHGQLPETELATTMARFMAKEIDILVASTIVEHGLDSAHANTLLVLRSEQFGLSDLYQLRGRVGRRTVQAYAVFFLGSIGHEEGYAEEENEQREAWLTESAPPPNERQRVGGVALTQTAQQRLRALLEADELGSGWSVALRDLEIRGGGNVLGYEQHGNVETIGLLLYAQLLQEEIGRQAQKLGIPLFQKPVEEN